MPDRIEKRSVQALVLPQIYDRLQLLADANDRTVSAYTAMLIKTHVDLLVPHPLPPPKEAPEELPL